MLNCASVLKNPDFNNHVMLRKRYNRIIMILNDLDKSRKKPKIVVIHVIISLFARDLPVTSSRFYQAISRSRSRSPPGFIYVPIPVKSHVLSNAYSVSKVLLSALHRSDSIFITSES